MTPDAADNSLSLTGLGTRVAGLRSEIDRLIRERRRETAATLTLAGLGNTPALDRITLEGPPSQRLRIRRLRPGRLVERSFSRSLGTSRIATDDPDVRELWERLLARERESEDVLRGQPASVLDVPGATVSGGAGRLRVVLGVHDGPVVAVPRFAYAFPERKLRNFGHWLLDCVPHANVLAAIAPDARLLVPRPIRPFYQATLALAGFGPDQWIEWDGAPIQCSRLLLMEHDGRTGGGRPLSPLADLRTRVAAGTRGSRRVYVSRRDARNKRHWVTNEAEVEAVFERHGFEILLMAQSSLDEQIRVFRDAGVVAGVSGAGLTDLLFAAEGTRAIVIVTDSLVRWYAAQGARALWASGTRGGAGQLAALGDSPRFYPHVAAAFGQISHALVSPDQVPLDVLSQFVHDVLREAN